jgi:hypothetical protein
MRPHSSAKQKPKQQPTANSRSHGEHWKKTNQQPSRGGAESAETQRNSQEGEGQGKPKVQ